VELSRLAVDVVGDLKLKGEPLIAGMRKVPPSRCILRGSGLLIVHEFLLDVLPDLVPHLRKTASLSFSEPSARPGSSKDQCSLFLAPGKKGQASLASSQTVIT